MEPTETSFPASVIPQHDRKQLTWYLAHPYDGPKDIYPDDDDTPRDWASGIPASQLHHACASEHAHPPVVAELIPRCSVAILAGDSGIGKSALVYQLAIAVAAGVPFLDFKTHRGNVVYMDSENGLNNANRITDSISRHLQLPGPPKNLTYHDQSSLAHERDPFATLGKIIERCEPILTLIDSLRAFAPDAEKDNSRAGAFLNGLRSLAKNYSTSILMVHHLRKPNEQQGKVWLKNTSIFDWVNAASGAKALINQSDVRLGIDRLSDVEGEDGALIIKAFCRVQGVIGPLYLQRILDPDGHPLGYVRSSAVELLENDDQSKAYKALPGKPHVLTFKEIMQAYGRRDEATMGFIRKCEGAALLRKIGKGRYEKSC